MIDAVSPAAPLLGRSAAIGLFSLLHIALAGLAVGFMVLAPVAEAMGRTRPHYSDAALAMTRFTLVTFTASVVLAVLMIELFVGLFPLTNTLLFNRFHLPITVAAVAFLAQLFLLYPYYHYWEPLRRARPRLHIAMGSAAAGLMLIWVWVLDGIGSFMLTPVQGDNPWALLLNPTWIPLGAHRFIGNLVMAGYIVAGYGAWRLRTAPDSQRDYYRHLARSGFVLGLIALMLQPASGLLYAARIEEAVPEAYGQLVAGRYQPLIYVQFALIGLLFFGSHLILATASNLTGKWWLLAAVSVAALGMVLSVGIQDLRRTLTFLLVGLTLPVLVATRTRAAGSALPDFNRPALRRIALALAVTSLLTYLTMGTIRETARRPYTVHGVITLQEEAATPAAFR